MKYLLFLFLVLIGFHSLSQCKSYRLTQKGDTINCIDQQDRRQGKWVVNVEGVRGEPGYDEEGTYKDGKKEGVWRVYTAIGDLYAIESFRWGNKDGRSQYYNIAGILREESWKAVNPEYPYDTVDVPDPIDPMKVERKVIKIEGTAVKHGTWKYYESGSGALTKSDNYFLGKIEDPMKAFANSGRSASTTNSLGSEDQAGTAAAKPPVKAKPKEVMEFEKKAGKKGKKVADGSTF